MHGCLHSRSNVARIYLLEKEGRRGLTGIENNFKHVYLRNSDEKMLQAALSAKVVKDYDETSSSTK